MSREAASAIQVTIVEVEDDSPVRFVVSGAPVHVSNLEISEPSKGTTKYELELTLNGEYTRTPHHTFSRVHKGGHARREPTVSSPQATLKGLDAIQQDEDPKTPPKNIGATTLVTTPGTNAEGIQGPSEKDLAVETAAVPMPSLSYQCLLMPLPRPAAEFSVFRFHEGSIKRKNLAQYNLSMETFEELTEEEPAKVFAAVRKEIQATVPDFVLYAKKGGTN